MGAGDCHGGLPRRLEGTKKPECFAADKRGKGGGAEMIFFGEELMWVNATKARRHEETRRFLAWRKALQFALGVS